MDDLDHALFEAPLTRQGNAGPIIEVRDVSFWYGERQALDDISLDISAGEVLALMGPSGCGKTTFLRLLNRMQDHVPGARMTGRIRLNGHDIHDPRIDPPLLRRRFGWVAQRPNPFPKTIRENVAYGARINKLAAEGPDLDNHVERCLRRANLWDEVKDRLQASALELSGGQQQRLCVARALGLNPAVLLMDEPCAGVDPPGAAKIEELIAELGREFAVVLITHNLGQARRLANRVAFFDMGRVVEQGPADLVFETPSHPRTRAYLAGAFG